MKLNYLTIFVAFLFFTLGPNIYSQEKGPLGLNAEFLDSLPDEVREDLLVEIEGNQSQLEEVDYGALSSLLKDPAARYIEQELLRSEIPTIPPQEIPLEDLKFFGEGFFKGLPLSFMPISDPSLSSDYVVGVGDILNVNIVGIKNINEGIKVAKDGTLTIKQVGKLYVSGLTLSQAEKRLQVLVSQNYPGSNSSLALSELESVQVLVEIMSELERKA